jgi:hypothetical protein
VGVGRPGQLEAIVSAAAARMSAWSPW